MAGMRFLEKGRSPNPQRVCDVSSPSSSRFRKFPPISLKKVKIMEGKKYSHPCDSSVPPLLLWVGETPKSCFRLTYSMTFIWTPVDLWNVYDEQTNVSLWHHD